VKYYASLEKILDLINSAQNSLNEVASEIVELPLEPRISRVQPT
jgi:hypothetical protein